MPGRNQYAPVQDGSPLTDQSIGDPTSRQTHEIHHRRVCTIDWSCQRRIESHAAHRGGRRHVEDEEPTHSVITEAFPHLAEEKSCQSARMTEERPIRRLE